MPRLPSIAVDPNLDPLVAVPMTRQGRHAGYVDMTPHVPADYAPVVAVPDGPYVLRDVDLEPGLLGVRPDLALETILAAGRTPLTIAEGVSVLLANPGILREQNCFQLMGSRSADRTVPSLWVTRDGRPRLGWCWEGNPHSWLAVASAAGRSLTR